jgi:tRNA threonylcarbamoyladenosine biosynthesis protein TsaE
MRQRILETNNAEETQQLGAEYAGLLKRGGVVLLFGELGSGKTTFTQGFARALGIQHKVISPTFLIMRTYDIAEDTAGKLYHLDLYRIASEKEIEEIGFAEATGGKENIIIVEWAERLQSLVPDKRTEIYFEYLDQDKRKVIIKEYD